MSSLYIPLDYSVCYKPDPEKGRIFYDSSPENFWRSCDTELNSQSSIIDCLPGLRYAAKEVNSRYPTQLNEDLIVIVDEHRLSDGIVMISMFSQSSDLLNKERVHLLRAYQPVEQKQLIFDFPLTNENLNTLSAHIDDIAKDAGVSVSITSFDTSYDQDEPNEEHNTFITVFGGIDAVNYAYRRVQVACDFVLNNCVIEIMDLSLSLQSLVAGIREGNLRVIENQSDCKIYMADSLPELFATHILETNVQISRNINQLYITGKSLANVELAKHMLHEVIRRTTPLVHKDCVMSFSKLDFLIQKSSDQIKSVMFQHGTFIQLPYLGAARSIVRVVGVNGWSVESSISELMRLASDFYSVSYMFHTGQKKTDNEDLLEQPVLQLEMPRLSSKSQTEGNSYKSSVYELDKTWTVLERIAANAGTVILCEKGTLFDIVGYRDDAKKATTMMTSLPMAGQYDRQIIYKLELSLEQKDFVAGKKAGKIHRVMKNSNVWIRFLPFNDYNFFLSLEADSDTAAQSGIQLLEDELPAEDSFYIPVMFHKQVIGVGGQRIQQIMRNYNVYVKFSNDHDDFPNQYCLEEPDNVIIRCPAKNAKNIPDAKNELLDSVDDRSLELCNMFVHMSRSHRRILVTEKANFLRDIELKTSTVILFPSDVINAPDGPVEVQGLAAKSEDASRMLRTILAEDYEFKVAYTTAFGTVCSPDSGNFYQQIVVPFRVALHIEVEVYQSPRNAETTTNPASDMITTHNTATPPKMPSKYHRIVLSYSAEHSMNLEEAIQILTSYLRAAGLNILDRGEIRGDPVEEGSAATLGHQRKQNSYLGRQRAETMPSQGMAAGGMGRPYY